MAGSWKEKDGSRQVNDTEPDYIDFIITFTAAAGTAKPTNGLGFTEVSTGGSALSSTGLAAEPKTVQVSEVTKRVGGTVDWVTCRFRGEYVINTA